MQRKKKDLGEKIIAAEIQKEGRRLDELLSQEEADFSENADPGADHSEHDKEEFEELMRKRQLYQEQVQREAADYYRQEQQKRIRRRAFMVKAAMLVLVVSGCVFAFSMRSEATKMWWLTSVERIIGKNRGNMVDNDEVRIFSDATEEEAVSEIEERTGIPMPKLQYQPKGMYFEEYTYDEVLQRAYLQYVCEKDIFFVNGVASDVNLSYTRIYDGTVLSENVVEAPYAEVEIIEVEDEDTQESNVTAEWTYRNYHYQLSGKLSVEEVEKIILNIFY